MLILRLVSRINSVALAFACSLIAGGLGNVAYAQTADTSIFAPLTLAPAPSQTRLANGTPGPKYWQNRADYDLKATLDTRTQTVSGSMTLRYTNNSPDTLHILWFQTEQDPNEPISRFVQSVKGKFVPVTLENHETETKVTLAEPIKPGAVATFQVAWQFNMSKVRGDRLGSDSVLYEVAQWYPRVNVYDDVKGWNTEPYTTNAEFYLEYGDYTLEVTVPASYIVAATGTLDNPTAVLTPTEIARLAVAARADTIVRVVTLEELKSGAARPTQSGMLTWKFHAKNVRDAVWCAAPNYQWDATSWKGILAQSYYRNNAHAWWEDAADMARMSIQEYSERWFPYPYPQVSVVEGPVHGMEYPMLSMNPIPFPPSNRALYNVITHEVGHNWFPMIVGSNERMHAWQDEGFNQFINTFSEARRYPKTSQAKRADFYVEGLRQVITHGKSAPLETGEVTGNTHEQYVKTAAVLQMLRRDVMGPAVFDKGLQTYIQRWAYKHPTPMDFYRTMNEVAGSNLDWFWREWFLEPVRFSQGIKSVRKTGHGADTTVIVTYRNKERAVMPLLVRITFLDNTNQVITYPADVWKANSSEYTVSYTFPGKSVTRIEVDPDDHLPDADITDHIWPMN